MGYNDFYYYGNPYGNGYGSTTVASAALGFPFVVLAFMVSIYAVIAYILRSIGLYHMAKSRGIAHAWFAWIPVLNYYVLGRLINNKVVLGDDIVLPHADFFLPFIGFLALSDVSTEGFLMGILVAAYWVYKMSAYWRLYKIYRPKSRTAFTVWSALIGSGFFIFAIRNDRPFDPLEPDKQYQNFYEQKKVVTDHYEHVEEGIKNRQQARQDAINQDYQEQLAQNPSEKEQITAQYNVDRNNSNDYFNSQLEANWREQMAATNNLSEATVEANTQNEMGNGFEVPQGSDFINTEDEILEISAPEAALEQSDDFLEISAPVQPVPEEISAPDEVLEISAPGVETTTEKVVEDIQAPQTSYTTIDTSDLEDSLAKIIERLDNE